MFSGKGMKDHLTNNVFYNDLFSMSITLVTCHSFLPTGNPSGIFSCSSLVTRHLSPSYDTKSIIPFRIYFGR
jgi:hypothetical protein